MNTKFYPVSLIPKLFMLLIVIGIAFSSGGCKSKKKLAQEAAAKEYADKVSKAVAELEALLNDDGTMPLAEKERRLNDIKAQNLNDQQVNDLIRQVEAKIEAEKEAQQLKEEQDEAKRKEEAKEQMRYNYIDEYFSQIAAAKNPETANAKIDETLKLFASPDVPVLIIINRSGGIVDYDKPTTIGKYLHYLKDTGNNANRIDQVTTDDYGQITAIELIKK